MLALTAVLTDFHFVNCCSQLSCITGRYSVNVFCVPVTADRERRDSVSSGTSSDSGKVGAGTPSQHRRHHSADRSSRGMCRAVKRVSVVVMPHWSDSEIRVSLLNHE